MALKLSVKIGDVTNLSDARYAAGMGVDYIGFNINPDSEHFVTSDKVTEIINWVSGVGIIGEIGEKLPIEDNGYGSMLIETSNIELESKLDEYVFRIDANAATPNRIEDLICRASKARFYVLCLSPDKIEGNEAILKDLCQSYPIYLSTNFDKALLEKIVTLIKPNGIEIKGSTEDQPGFKDYDGIADVLEWLEIE